MDKKLLLIAFALSGMTALIYEVVWTRPLQFIFGSTIYAASIILTTLFIGFALGAYAFRNLADEIENPERLFGLLELGIGLYGLIIIYLFAILSSIYLSLIEIPGIQFIQFLLIFLVLIIPATLFGATWPVMNKAYASLGNLGKDSGKLYSFNSFGAFAGSIGAGFLLIPLFGIKKTSIFVACLNILIAITILVFSKKMKGDENEY
jgi:spermidine synthase